MKGVILSQRKNHRTRQHIPAQGASCSVYNHSQCTTHLASLLTPTSYRPSHICCQSPSKSHPHPSFPYSTLGVTHQLRLQLCKPHSVTHAIVLPTCGHPTSLILSLTSTHGCQLFPKAHEHAFLNLLFFRENTLKSFEYVTALQSYPSSENLSKKVEWAWTIFLAFLSSTFFLCKIGIRIAQASWAAGSSCDQYLVELGERLLSLALPLQWSLNRYK